MDVLGFRARGRYRGLIVQDVEQTEHEDHLDHFATGISFPAVSSQSRR